VTGYWRAAWTFLTAWSWGLPSLAVEILSGLATYLLALPLAWGIRQIGAPGPLTWLAFGVALLLSVGYEWKLDANGWSWVDVGQREVGIGLAFGIAFLIGGGMLSYVIVALLAFVGGLLVGRKVWAGKLVGKIGDVAQGVAKKL
jgi:hypothetical protein